MVKTIWTPNNTVWRKPCLVHGKHLVTLVASEPNLFVMLGYNLHCFPSSIAEIII